VPLPEPLRKAPVGRETLSRETLAQRHRRQIVVAAIGVFAKRGFQRTTIDDIVVAADSSVGGFYGLFDGKEHCFLQCYDWVVDDVREQILAAIPHGASWPDQVCAAVAALLAFVEAKPLAARIVLVEAQTAGLDGLKQYQATLDGLATALRGGRNLLSAEEELPRNLEEATVAGSAWLLHERLMLGKAGGVSTLLPEFMAILLGSYIGERRARKLAERAPVAATA
jgi:AcrR family transcriptional regulator